LSATFLRSVVATYMRLYNLVYRFRQKDHLMFFSQHKRQNVILPDGAEQGKIITGIWYWKTVGSLILSFLILVRNGMYKRLLDELVQDLKPDV